jgi:hypothetical protein
MLLLTSGGCIVKKIVNFVKERGFLIMMSGMFIVVAGVMAYMAIMNTHMSQSPYMRQAAMALVFIGVGVYGTGRLSVAAQRRREKLRDRIESRRGRLADDDDEL